MGSRQWVCEIPSHVQCALEETPNRNLIMYALQSKESSTRIKDAGIAIRHSQEYIISILQGPEMSLYVVGIHTKGSCT